MAWHRARIPSIRLQFTLISSSEPSGYPLPHSQGIKAIEDRPSVDLEYTYVSKKGKILNICGIIRWVLFTVR